MNILLTKDEREKFIRYCEITAESDNAMSRQLEVMLNNKLAGAEGMIAKKYKTTAAAYTIVANELKRIEDMELYEPTPR